MTPPGPTRTRPPALDLRLLRILRLQLVVVLGSDAGPPSTCRLARDSDSSDDGQRVVRSAKEKRFIEVRATIDEMRNKIKINDWMALQTLFDKLNKQLEKVMRAGRLRFPVLLPRARRFRGRHRTNLREQGGDQEDVIHERQGVQLLRQRLKKHFRDDKTMAAGIARAKAQPDSTEDEASDSDSDSDSSDDEAARAEKAEKKARKAAEKAAQSGTDVDDGFAVVGKKGQVEKPGAAKPLDVKAPKEKVTYEMVDKKLADLIASRGKKGTDRHENVETLAYVATVATCAAQEIEVLVMLISAQFDISGSMSTHMPIPIWKKCVNNLLRIDAVIKAEPTDHAGGDLRARAQTFPGGYRRRRSRAAVGLALRVLRAPGRRVLQEHAEHRPAHQGVRASACRTNRCSSSSRRRW